MIAGIMVLGLQSPTEHISIIDNEVTVDTTSSSYAAQALLIYSYTPTLQITGNGIEAINIATNHTKPASALFMQINPSFIGNFSDTPLISGNTINGNPAYDFYINIMSHDNRVGVQEMLANGFATPASTWMAAASTDTGDTRSFYKRLIETLLPQIRTGSGYGYLAMYLNNGDDCVFEAYERRNSRLYAIDFWGYTIDKGAYTSKEVRARLLLNSAGEVAKNVEQFHWTYTITDTNIPALP
jgi:hypothetical protein